MKVVMMSPTVITLVIGPIDVNGDEIGDERLFFPDRQDIPPIVNSLEIYSTLICQSDNEIFISLCNVILLVPLYKLIN